MKFTYQAYDKSGSERTGIIDAKNDAEVYEQLRKKGLFVSNVVQGEHGSQIARKAKLKKGSKVPQRVVSDFSRELAVLVSTGTPLVDAISSIEQQAKLANWKEVVSQVRQRLEEGDSLASALESHKNVFDPVFRSLVAAGESSGHLDSMLHRVAILTRKQSQIRSNLLGTMMYPVLLLGVATIVIGLMIGVVLPRFAGMFESIDTELPATTAFLMGISDFVRSYWWGVLPAFIACIGGICWWLTQSQGQQWVIAQALKIPKVGVIIRSFMTARITRLLGVLLEAKVPMIEAIELTRESLGIDAYKGLMNQAQECVTQGEPISTAFSSGGLMTASACEAVRNGEQSGRLAEVMVHVADYLDEDNETIIKSLSTLIEPVIMIGLGILVGFVAISMFLPLFDLTASAGGGAV